MHNDNLNCDSYKRRFARVTIYRHTSKIVSSNLTRRNNFCFLIRLKICIFESRSFFMSRRLRSMMSVYRWSSSSFAIYNLWSRRRHKRVLCLNLSRLRSILLERHDRKSVNMTFTILDEVCNERAKVFKDTTIFDNVAVVVESLIRSDHSTTYEVRSLLWQRCLKIEAWFTSSCFISTQTTNRSDKL